MFEYKATSRNWDGSYSPWEKESHRVKERLAFSIAFVAVVVLFERVLKTKQKNPKYYSKTAPRNKGLSLNLSTFFPTSQL